MIALVLIAVLLVPAFAGAAEGWYLLVPPPSEYNENAEFLQGYNILTDKPLPQWSQQGAYESAADCEATRSSLTLREQNVYSKSKADYMKALGGGTDSPVLKGQRLLLEGSSATLWALLISRCIRSDDPRLRP